MKFTIILALLAVSVFTQAPAPPPQADEWYATFSEKLHFPLRGDSHTTGKWWYSWTQKKFRVDRENGNYDRYCGLTKKFTNTPCSQIVNGGTRYLWFPKYNYCCNCCSAEHGCGIVTKDWMKTGTFEGQHTDKAGVVYNEWNVKGNQKNIWGATTDAKPYRFYQEPLSDMYWNVGSYSTAAISPDTFKLPSKDCNKYCPFFSICTEIRQTAHLKAKAE